MAIIRTKINGLWCFVDDSQPDVPIEAGEGLGTGGEMLATLFAKALGGELAGVPGPVGPGVPAGGTAGQVLSKIDATNFNTQWNHLADLLGTKSLAITRDGDGLVASVTEAGGRTKTFTRDENNRIVSWTDGAWVWTVTRNETDQITGIVVDEA